MTNSNADAPQQRYNNVVLVDMDNTLVGYDDEFAKRYAQLRPEDDLSVIRNRTKFEIQRNFDPSLLDTVYSIMRSEDFFSSLSAYPGAIAALDAMLDHGLDVFLCSAPSTFQFETASSSKFAWVRKHMGDRWLRRLILTRDKTIVKGAVLVDDKPSITGACPDPDWTQIIFTQSYNKQIEGKPRMSNWDEWKQVVLPFFPHLPQQ